jgi:hypothetical protein
MGYLVDFILGLPVACYLYGLLYGNRHKRNTGTMTTDHADGRAQALRVVPGVPVCSALTALNLVYLVFFLAQASYLFSAFRDDLPTAMTYSEYARRGFFELCAVSGINLAVTAAAYLLAKRDKMAVFRGETAALCLFTILLIATAMSKLGMYISYYGLTRLRVYAAWFMAVLLFLFVLVLVRQFRRFNGTRIAVVGCICLFLGLCYGNADGLIAKHNIDRYQAGTLETLDVPALWELSDGAAPYLHALYLETEDSSALKDELRVMLQEAPFRRGGMLNDFSDLDFRAFNLQTWRADRLRETL